jgi:GNAT superfamily N-acetyltransferase
MHEHLAVRDAARSELDALATIWHEGWRDAHLAIVPAGLAAMRTRDSFHRRLTEALAGIRTVGRVGDPLGFAIVKGDELYQLYVSAAARRTGVASALIADAEERLRNAGVTVAWLACAIGNDRAAAFYEKKGWSRVGTMLNQLDASTNRFELEVWRYEKRLR